MNSRSLPLRLTAFLALIATTSAADAVLHLHLGVSAQYEKFYVASAGPSFFPNGPDLSFTTGRISSADNQYVLFTQNNGWRAEQPHFDSLAALVNSLNQPWEMLFDAGLPTERHYTMSLNLGDLPIMDLTPPTPVFPTHNSVVQTQLPTFSFISQPQYSYDLQVGRFEGNTSTIVASPTLPGGSATWTPSTPLLPGNYYLRLGRSNIGIPQLGFTTPIDDLGNPLPNWQTNGHATIEANLSFTIVPEPTSLTLLLAATVLLPAFRTRRWITRFSRLAP
jgi:hypothetical protein